jgi:hypothetical protein
LLITASHSEFAEADVGAADPAAVPPADVDDDWHAAKIPGMTVRAAPVRPDLTKN